VKVLAGKIKKGRNGHKAEKAKRSFFGSAPREYWLSVESYFFLASIPTLE
jgi:hypothetical protein